MSNTAARQKARDKAAESRDKRGKASERAVLSGQGRWVTVQGKDGEEHRVWIKHPRVPDPAHKVAAAHGMAAGRAALKREQSSWRERVAAHRAKAGAGVSRPDREAQRHAAAMNRARSGIIARRTKELNSEAGTRHFEYRLRRAERHEVDKAYSSGLLRPGSRGKYVVEERITDKTPAGESRSVKDWTPRGFGHTRHEALRESWDSSIENARPLAQVHRRVKAAMDATRQRNARASELNETVRRTEDALVGGAGAISRGVPSLKGRFEAKYQEALKRAKLSRAAKQGTADPKKIEEIAAPLREEYGRKVSQAKEVIARAAERAKRLRENHPRAVTVPNERAARIAQRAAARATPPPTDGGSAGRKLAPGRGTEDRQFAATALRAARQTGSGERFGPDKAYISDVYERAKARGFKGSLDEFKGRLTDAGRRGHVSLSRADLVEAMPKGKVAASATGDGNDQKNFVRVASARNVAARLRGRRDAAEADRMEAARARPSLREQADAARAAKGSRVARAEGLYHRSIDSTNKAYERWRTGDRSAADQKAMDDRYSRTERMRGILSAEAREAGRRAYAEQTRSAPTPAAPSLREQAAAHRAGKGDRKERARVIIERLQVKARNLDSEASIASRAGDSARKRAYDVTRSRSSKLRRDLQAKGKTAAEHAAEIRARGEVKAAKAGPLWVRSSQLQSRAERAALAAELPNPNPTRDSYYSLARKAAETAPRGSFVRKVAAKERRKDLQYNRMMRAYRAARD